MHDDTLRMQEKHKHKQASIERMDILQRLLVNCLDGGTEQQFAELSWILNRAKELKQWREMHEARIKRANEQPLRTLSGRPISPVEWHHLCRNGTEIRLATRNGAPPILSYL